MTTAKKTKINVKIQYTEVKSKLPNFWIKNFSNKHLALMYCLEDSSLYFSISLPSKPNLVIKYSDK